MFGSKKSLDNYSWGMKDFELAWVQTEQFCSAQYIGRSIWQNGPDDNVAYHFTPSGKTVHIHYKADQKRIYTVHEKHSNNSNQNIARLNVNAEPLTPGEVKNMLKLSNNYPNHAKLFELVVSTYNFNNPQNNNVEMSGEVNIVESDL